MGTVDFKTERTFDRRIGQRLELDGIDVINVSWVVPQTGRFGRAKPPIELPGRIENVSVTGAGIVGPRELALKPGDEAVVRCGGRDNIVSIRHCAPTGDERTMRYGVEITSVQPNLQQRIRELLDATLTRAPVEAPPPGALSLRGVARPAVPQAPVEPRATDTAPPDAQDDHAVLDLTDATMASQGAAVVDLTQPVAVAVEPDPVAEAPERDPHVPVAKPVHLPPVEMSEGRRVLEEVFGLMED